MDEQVVLDPLRAEKLREGFAEGLPILVRYWTIVDKLYETSDSELQYTPSSISATFRLSGTSICASTDLGRLLDDDERLSIISATASGVFRTIRVLFSIFKEKAAPYC